MTFLRHEGVIRHRQLNQQMVSFTILRPSYLHNGLSYTGKTAYLYWIGTLHVFIVVSLVVVLIHEIHIIRVASRFGADHRKHQSSSLLAFVRGIHRWPVRDILPYEFYHVLWLSVVQVNGAIQQEYSILVFFFINIDFEIQDGGNQLSEFCWEYATLDERQWLFCNEHWSIYDYFR